jgi:hypothetical protein
LSQSVQLKSIGVDIRKKLNLLKQKQIKVKEKESSSSESEEETASK